jgi:hypothetical protein
MQDEAASIVQAAWYDPLSMPPALVSVHAKLDQATNLCYRLQPFISERQRMEYLFGLLEQLNAPLLPPAEPKQPWKRISTRFQIGYLQESTWRAS